MAYPLPRFRREVARRHLHERRSRRGSAKWLWGLLVLLIAAPVVAVAALFGLAGSSATAADLSLGLLDSSFGQMPPAKNFSADSLIYARDKSLIADIHPSGESRLPISLDAVALPLQQATVDVEDRNFWHEGAVDPGRIVAATFDDLVHGAPLQGASTITQQLAKVKYLTNAPDLARKARELFVARHIESTMSKQQKLEEYLNDIPYGHGAIGIQATAHTYFGIDASKLDVAESALLAGLPDAPTDLDPLVHPEAAAARQKVVLGAMVQAGDLTQAQADQAAAEQLKFASGNDDNINSQPAFVARVNQEIAGLARVDPQTSGLQVVTTLDPALQRFAQQTVQQQVQTLRGQFDATDGALVSLDPRNGDVLAYIGDAGPGTPGGQIDMAAAPRQPGSTFKLFTYSAALNLNKITMLTPVLDAPLSVPMGAGSAPYVVQNYDSRYHGLLPVEMALGNSLNVPAVKIELYTGIANIVQTARAMGVTSLDQDPNGYPPSLTLGAFPVPLWEMAQAASSLAASGHLAPAHFVNSVKDGGGKELLPNRGSGGQVLDPATVFVMNQMLSDDTNRTLEFGANSPLTLGGHSVAAKTGTTNDFKDNLTIGWTPQLVTAAWVGNADNHAMHGTTGITGAAPIWHDVMAAALAGKPDDWPGPPPGVHQASFEGHSGWLKDGTAPANVPELTGGLRAAPTVESQPRTSPTASASAVVSAEASASAPASASASPSSPASASASPSAAQSAAAKPAAPAAGKH